MPPKNTQPFSLFEYSVQRVLELGMMGESRTHLAWANLIFRYEKKSHVRSELMSIVKREFSGYFDKELQYMFLEDKIRANYPQFFGAAQNTNLFVRMVQALDAECTEQKDPKNRKMYRVSSLDRIALQDTQYIYRAHLAVEEGDDPRFSEGVPFDFWTQVTIFSCEVVEFDFVNALLFFSSTKLIVETHDMKVISDATMNTIALQNVIKETSVIGVGQSIPLRKFLNNTTRELSPIDHADYPSYLDVLLSKDKSQFQAFLAALGHDITFIWGPPGTGKSYTLSAIIMALYYMPGERTAVCCLSNVAVDQLVSKVVAIIEENEPDMARGEFYRAGRTQDVNLLEKEFLFPNDARSFMLRKKIKNLNEQIDTFRKKGQQYSVEAIQIKAMIKDAREKLKEHTDYLISKVRVVFSTISNFVINTKLKDGYFDNLIVDEASMLAQPQLIALARNVTKRIILVGDFQQLSPITVAGVPILRDSVFKLCGIDINHTDHPALHQLLNQRRSNPKLVDIINHSFYADRLVAQNSQYNSIVAKPPYGGSVIGMKCVADGAVRFTKGGTRQNTANAEAVMGLMDVYSQEEEATYSIGIITPYTGQVSLLKALFIGREFDIEFQERVKIGTVHTFQGSECDVIIFDMVDCSKFEKGNKSYFGRIYAGEQGEQLLNVAISRARHKLIVVCEPEYIERSPGGLITDKSQSIFNSLLKSRMTRE